MAEGPEPEEIKKYDDPRTELGQIKNTDAQETEIAWTPISSTRQSPAVATRRQ
jgi:hypothetical protein